jgi:hypothetical protein
MTLTTELEQEIKEASDEPVWVEDPGPHTVDNSIWCPRNPVARS